MDNKILYKVFGEAAKNSDIINRMMMKDIDNNKFKYSYLTPESFITLSIIQGTACANQYLAKEILQRVYFAVITGYLREYRWLEGMCQSISNENYIMFMSSIRGFVEASTDFYDACECIPLTLAEEYKIVHKAIKGEISEVIISFDELEKSLLHFQEANKSREKKEKVYIAKSAKSYMESKNLKHLNLYECYGELCEVTHPAKDSLDLFINDNDNIYTFNLNKDKELINKFILKYSKKLSELLMRSENLCVTILKVLNLFGVQEIYTESMERVNIDNIPVWKKIIELV